MAQTLNEAWRASKAHGNNFDALRLLAALMVIFSHAGLTTLGHPEGDPLYRISNVGMGDLGLFIFFIVSGFLITKSWQSDPVIGRFIAKRGLRIMPALLVVVLVSAFIIGPALSTLSASQYFSHGDVYRYLGNIALNNSQYSLPGVFSGSVYPDAFNAPLWTIAFEVVCYAIILAFGVCGLLAKNKPTFVSSAGLCGILALLLSPLKELLGDAGFGVLPDHAEAFAVLGTAFLVGAVFSLCDRFIVLNSKAAIACALLIAIAAPIGKIVIAFSFFGAYLVFFLAFARLGSLKNLGASGDYSYGLYLWAWPVQQIIATAFPQNHWTMNLMLTLPIAFGFAYLSWHLIERPALAFKPKKDHRPKAQSPELAEFSA